MFQNIEILDQLLGLRTCRRILGHKDIHNKGDGERKRCKTDDIGPAKRLRQDGREKGGKRGPRISGAGYAKRQALMLRRVPARGQRQGHGEGGSRHAQDQPERQNLTVGMQAKEPGRDEASDDDKLGKDAGLLRTDMIHQNAVDEAQQRASQHGRGHHEALLSRIEVEGFCDRDPKRSEDHPDHETQIKIKEGGEQGRRMASLQEGLGRHGRALSRCRVAVRRLHRRLVTASERPS